MCHWSAMFLDIGQVMRNAKLSCSKIFDIVYFGFAWGTGTEAFASVDKSCSFYKGVQDHVAFRLEVKSTECLTVWILTF